MTIWYALGLYSCILGARFYAMGRSSQPSRSDDWVMIVGCDSVCFAAFAFGFALIYWLRLRTSHYRRADAHFFALSMGLLTPAPFIGSMALAEHFGSGDFGPVALVGLWFFIWPLLAAQLTVYYCRWRKFPPDSPAT